LDFIFFLKSVLPITIIEILAAIFGLYYLKKVKPKDATRYFVYFLWLIVVVESFGAIPAIAYFTNYEYFGFLKDTFFQRNSWLYNIFTLITSIFYTLYFFSFTDFKLKKLFIKIAVFIYFIYGVYLLLDISVLGSANVPFITIGGAIIMFLSIMTFYMQLLKSDLILKLQKYLPFYISIGVLIFYLCTTPIEIYMNYFKEGNEFFMTFKTKMYLYLNLFLYGSFILGFILCSKKNKFY